jgi:hypothetical protein
MAQRLDRNLPGANISLGAILLGRKNAELIRSSFLYKSNVGCDPGDPAPYREVEHEKR